MFVYTSEKELSTLGGGYLKNFLSTSTLDKGFCTLTDKRIYFKGSCYYRTEKGVRKSKSEQIVSLKDVTGTGFIETRYWLLVILGVLLDLASFAFDIFLFMLGLSGIAEGGLAILIGLLLIPLSIALAAGIIFVSKIYYNLTKQKFFEISYAGGKIAFKASSYALSEMQDFQKVLHQAKDILMQ